MPEVNTKLACFVVMGYGKKTDFQQDKSFDLDKRARDRRVYYSVRGHLEGGSGFEGAR
jgi:hypothetical protein